MTPYMTGKMRTLLATTAAGLALAGCEAGATDKKSPETAEFTKLAAVVETADEMKQKCRLLLHETAAQKAVKKACYADLKALRQDEIAALNEGLLQDSSEIAALDQGLEIDDETIALKEKESEKLRKTIEVLSEIKEALKE